MIFQHHMKTIILLSVLLLSVLGFYLASSFSTAGARLVRNTVFSYQIHAGTGEGVMAIDPTNSSRMVYHALGLFDNVPFFSSDGGATWRQTPAFTVSTPTNDLDPWATYDSQGNAYVSTYTGNKTHPYDRAYPFLAKSTDHGASFSLLSTSYSPPSTMWTMPDGTLKLSCFMSGVGAIDFPKIAADEGSGSPYRDYVYIVGAVAVNNTGSGLCYGQTGFIRSTDGGSTWDAHKVLAWLNGQAIGRPDNLAVSPNGTVYFATGSYAGSGGVLIVYSKDGGMTWSTSAITLGFIALNPWIAVDRNNSKNLYVAFERTLKDNSVHIFMISSSTGGAAWSSPVRLDDILPQDAVDHTLPSMAISQDGHILVAWRDYRNTVSKTWSNENATDIYGYSSASAGANIRISNSTGRYCGPYTSCFSVPGNDYFEVTSGYSTDYVAFSLDENGNSWPQAYAVSVSYSSGAGEWAKSLAPLTIISGSWTWLAAGLAVGLCLTFMITRRHRRDLERYRELKQASGPVAVSLYGRV